MSAIRVPRRNYRLLLLLVIGAVLLLGSGHGASPAAAAGPHLYVTNLGDNKLIVSNLDGTSPADKGDLGGKLNYPTGIAIDVKNQQMYIANYYGNNVIRANLDGSGATTLNFGAVSLSWPMGIALDLVNQKIYVVNFGTNAFADTVVKANLDGTGAIALDLGGNLQDPWAIALDAANNYMYVTSSSNNKVVRAGLNGSSPTVLNFGSVTVTGPTGIALDSVASKMYIATYDDADANNNHLIKSNLDGSGAIDLGNPGNLLLGASGIAVDHDNQKLYIANAVQTGSKVVRTDLNGGNPVNLTSGPAWAGLLSYSYFVALEPTGPVQLEFIHLPLLNR